MAHGKSKELAEISNDPVIGIITSGRTARRDDGGMFVSRDGRRYTLDRKKRVRR